jgi:SPX domain protein involved in polyphosphate accumulation
MSGPWWAHAAPETAEPLAAAFRRYEYKFPLPECRRREAFDLIAPHVRHDEHCGPEPGDRYLVRSIYLDTDDLRFYREKVDGVRVRRKLRVRAYDRLSEDSVVFLEIKRRRGRRTFKERLPVPWGRAMSAVRDGCPGAPVDEDPSARRVLESFRFHTCTIGLKPIVLVAYEREAFVDPMRPRVRVTLDDGLRSLWAPSLDQLGEQRGLQRFARDLWILEFKFDDRMPHWMAQVMSRLELCREPYSKFCHGIDACAPRRVLQAALGRREV